MEKYEIEDGIPMPDEHVGPNGKSKYPFPVMEIGQSIRIENYHKGELARISARVYGSRSGKRFRSKRLSDGSVRIWRAE